jgi:hypothetical protein
MVAIAGSAERESSELLFRESQCRLHYKGALRWFANLVQGILDGRI